MNEESMWQAAHRMEDAAAKSQRAAQAMEQAASRIACQFENGYGGNGLRLIELLEDRPSTADVGVSDKNSALEIDAKCFRFWVRQAACAPGALASAIAKCTTEQEYRDVLIALMLAADEAIDKARRAA